MSIEKHSLVKEFPDHQHTIRHLKMNDLHFAKLFDEYHELDHEIFGIESSNSNTSDEYLDGLKKKRVALKDTLYQTVKHTESAQ